VGLLLGLDTLDPRDERRGQPLAAVVLGGGELHVVGLPRQRREAHVDQRLELVVNAAALVVLAGQAGRALFAHPARCARRTSRTGANQADVNSRDAATRNEGLAPFEHRVVAVKDGEGLQARGIRAGGGFGQAIARDLLHRAQRRQIPLSLFGTSETVDHPRRHVVDRQIGRRGRARRRQFLEDDRGVDPAEPAAAELLADINRSKPQRRRPAQRLDRKLLALVPARRLRQPLLARKRPRRLAKRPLLLRKLEIHAGRYSGRPASGNRSRN